MRRNIFSRDYSKEQDKQNNYHIYDESVTKLKELLFQTWPIWEMERNDKAVPWDGLLVCPIWCINYHICLVPSFGRKEKCQKIRRG